jgi:hypothetical protein
VTRDNGHSNDGNLEVGVLQELPVDEIPTHTSTSPNAPRQLLEPATRTKQRAKQQIQQNRMVIIAAGAIVAALLVFAAVSMPRRGEPRKAKSRSATTADRPSSESSDLDSDKSLFPIIDSGRLNTSAKTDHQGFLSERDLERTVMHRVPTAPQTGQTNAAGTLGSIPPFGDQAWQAPPYQPGSSFEVSDPDKAEHEGMEKPSLIYVQKVSAAPTGARAPSNTVSEPGLGLATGTRLRARLESAASTAVRAPVLAVIEYNYERDGEIVVPAGAKAVGHIRNASRSGYVDIQFDALLMQDGASVPIDAAATDLDLRPLKGKVEGKNTGKNILVRSLSGIGQAGSVLIGRGSLSQPLGESDLMRERMSSNIGEAGDEQLSRLAMNQHIVVTLSAGVPIYVVLEQTPKQNPASVHSAGQSSQSSTAVNIEQLRQLLQLQQELGQSAGSSSAQ